MKISGGPLVEILETGREGHPGCSKRDALGYPVGEKQK